MAWRGSGVRIPSAPPSNSSSAVARFLVIRRGPGWEPGCRRQLWLGFRAVATAKTASTSNRGEVRPSQALTWSRPRHCWRRSRGCTRTSAVPAERGPGGGGAGADVGPRGPGAGTVSVWRSVRPQGYTKTVRSRPPSSRKAAKTLRAVGLRDAVFLMDRHDAWDHRARGQLAGQDFLPQSVPDLHPWRNVALTVRHGLTLPGGDKP